MLTGVSIARGIGLTAAWTSDRLSNRAHSGGFGRPLICASLPMHQFFLQAGRCRQTMRNVQAQVTLAGSMDEFLASQERRAFNMALMATGNRDDALEIVQDAMFKLVQKYSNKEPASWGPLFTRILQNRIKNWYRRQSLTRRWFGRGATENVEQNERDAAAETSVELPDAFAHSTPATEAQQQRFMNALEAALRDLPLRQQQVFLLRAVQGLDVGETAAAMSCSAGSVKTHYSRALQKLKLQLAEYS